MTHPFADLDDLFQEAKAAARRVAGTKEAKKKDEEDEKIATKQLYSNPANWLRGRNIVLIHAETKTLLGAFIEWTHRSVEGCRRLVRDETGLLCDTVEEVSGDWGWQGPQKRQSHVEAQTTEVELFISLDYPPMAAKGKLRVTHNVGIHSADLVDSLAFRSADGTFLQLPSGTNVFELMTHACKVQLKKELECQSN